MDNENYIKNALKTESLDFDGINERLKDKSTVRALHASLGMVTELGELADVFKKHLFYGKPIDWVNIEEELGDLFWYLAVMADVLHNTDFDAIMQKNINKLAKRYPNQVFTSDSAINRNTNAEREILEVPSLGLKINHPFQKLTDQVELEIKNSLTLSKESDK